VIGKVRSDKQYTVHNNGEKIIDAPAEEVTKGFLYDRPYQNPNHQFHEPKLPDCEDYNNILKKMLSHENIASRSVVYESYDKQVQGRTITEAGKSDSGVMAPFNSENYPKEIRKIGIALSTDHNPRISIISPYWGGVNAVVEAMRNVASVGATPHAVSDCLCFGNPEKPHQMWEFVEAVRGVSDACNAITLKETPECSTPIIAGNVSFYNESKSGAIPPSPIVSCLGRIKNVEKTITMSLKNVDSVILMIGARKDELGGSLFYDLHGELGANVPSPNLEEVKRQIFSITDCIDQGLLYACHDISDGGIAVAISEMTFDNNIGCSVTIPGSLPLEKLLFTETGGFVIEANNKNLEQVETILTSYDLDYSNLGTTNNKPQISINDTIEISVEEAKTIWSHGLRDKIK
jgi:phosphoribosylformylglycinamidine synthase